MAKGVTGMRTETEDRLMEILGFTHKYQLAENERNLPRLVKERGYSWPELQPLESDDEEKPDVSGDQLLSEKAQADKTENINSDLNADEIEVESDGEQKKNRTRSSRTINIERASSENLVSINTSLDPVTIDVIKKMSQILSDISGNRFTSSSVIRFLVMRGIRSNFDWEGLMNEYMDAGDMQFKDFIEFVQEYMVNQAYSPEKSEEDVHKETKAFLMDLIYGGYKS